MAALSLVAGPRLGGVLARFVGFTPLVWVAYLAAVWAEGLHRLCNDGGQSDVAIAMRAVGQHVAAERARRRQQHDPAAGGAGGAHGGLPSADARREQLSEALAAQPTPARVFDAVTCPICFGELAAQGGAGAGVSAAEGGDEGGGKEGSGSEASSDDDDALQVLRCGHAYHRGCVLAWLERNHRCPVCREVAVGGGRHANLLF